MTICRAAEPYQSKWSMMLAFRRFAHKAFDAPTKALIHCNCVLFVYFGSMTEAWWKEAVIYQVYPSSFLDTNGDGWGDVKGVGYLFECLKRLETCLMALLASRGDMKY
jgi:hypothetical protein